MVKGQKYHILYKTTCTVTGNFYVGVHSTTNLEDGYLGSGKRLSRSVEKYGKENHVREILEFFETREELLSREREVVNDELLKEEKCMNLKPGGEGGLNLLDKETVKRISTAGGSMSRYQSFEFRSEYTKRGWKGKKGKQWGNWKGRSHSEDTKRKIGEKTSQSQRGEKNSQFGKVWIRKGNENKKIPKDQLSSYLKNGWEKGRKMVT